MVKNKSNKKLSEKLKEGVTRTISKVKFKGLPKRKISSGRGITPKAIPSSKLLNQFTHPKEKQVPQQEFKSRVPDVQDKRSLFFKEEFAKTKNKMGFI